MPTHDNLRERRIRGGVLNPVIVVNPDGEDIGIGIPVDCLVKAVTQIDYEHHEIHEGEFFIVDHINLTLGAAAIMSLGATIPAGVFCHFRFSVNAGGAAHVELVENVGFTDGVAETVFNANRNGPAAPFAALSDATLAGGTVILEYTVASGAGPKAAGGGGGTVTEIVCKDDETYVIRLTNLTNGAIAASILVGFYTRDTGICS